MSYLRRWRQNHAEVRALAMDSSSDDDIPDVIEQGILHEEVAPNLTDQNIETDSDESIVSDGSDFGFSETVQSSESDSESLSENEIDEKSFREKLATWSTKSKVSKSAIDDLLILLRSEGNVDIPKDARTLLQTPKSIELEEKCGGKYIYFGIKIGLAKILALKSFSVNNVVENMLNLNFNIDGIPLFKSSSTQFWPILCSLGNYTPFIVSIFYGSGKPNSCEDFLTDFLTELNELVENGLIYNENTFNIRTNAFICDAPARAFLKNIKGHTGYYACERCTIKGYWKDNRVGSLF